MRKYIFLVAGMLLIISAFSQSVAVTHTENFDSAAVNLLSFPAKAWKVGFNHDVNASNYYRAMVPNMLEDSVILQTPVYNLSGLHFIEMRFKHICKVSPNDMVRIEYRIPGQTWMPVPPNDYLGKALNYGGQGFNAASYFEWLSDDSLAIPNQYWWKEELFDLSHVAQNATALELRFILKRGMVQGTQISYGWLIDDLEIVAAPYEIRMPVVEFISPLIKDTVYSVGPYNINAKVKTQTTARIENPWLVYTSTFDNISVTDSILMTNVIGDSLWVAAMPQFVAGTSIVYSITGKDTNGNMRTANSRYYIKRFCGLNLGSGKSESIITLTPNNGSGGVAFDVEAGLQAITLTGFETSFATSGATTVHMYYRTGSVCGACASSAGWILIGQQAVTITATGYTSRTYVPIPNPVIIPPGQTYGFYFIAPTSPGGGMQYVTGSSTCNATTVATNNDLTIMGGHGITTPTAPFTGTINTERNFGGTIYYIAGNGSCVDDSNSVTLASIDNPKRETIIGGVPNPIVVTIHNAGVADLDSAMVYWTVNGKNLDSTVWRGNLPWDFKTQDTIGYYTPRPYMYDTLTVWVSMPNGQIDSTLKDDTLSLILYGCTQHISGVQTIGEGKNFSSIGDVFELITNCAISGDLILSLDSGVYEGSWDFTNLNKIMGNYNLTITSASGNPNDVILRADSGTAAIILNNSDNLTIKDITIDATKGTFGINFTGACTNVVIRDCKILANYTATAVANGCGIYKPTATGIVENISFIHNIIDGGYSGFYFYAGTGTSAYGKNIVFDSNIVSNQYYYATYLYYTDFKSMSYNQMTSRSVNQGTTWYGIRLYYVRNGGNVIGNKIRSDNPGISSTIYGMYIYYTDSALVANNEIYLNSSASTTYGMYLYYSNHVDYIHNSVVLTGSGGATFRAAQIYVATTSSYYGTYQNNMFVANGGTTPYAVYLSAAPGATFSQFNYINSNIYYSSGALGYAGSARASLKVWQSVVVTDSNSVEVYPEFADIQTDLKVSNYADIMCDLLPLVNNDINNKSRTGITTMGCYESFPNANYNGMLIKLLGLRDGTVAGQSDSIKLVIYNTGNNPITSFNIEWAVNDVSKAAGGVTYTTSLSKGEFDTISLGEITYNFGMMDVRVWFNSLNGSSTLDEFNDDDTIHIANFICQIMLGGTVTIGNTGDYPTVNEALDMALLCGISGNVTLVLDSGTYEENWNLSDIVDVLGSDTLTITSASGRAEDVVLHPNGGVAVLLGNSDNITIKNITIDATEGTFGIQITDACTNIVIDHCIIIADSVATATGYAGIYKASGTGGLVDMSITNCTVTGGYHGIYLYGASA
jgi:hypothetical protein